MSLIRTNIKKILTIKSYLGEDVAYNLINNMVKESKY